MKLKRIAAIAGVLLLIALYASTLIFALLKSELASQLLIVSILATFFIPTIIYAMNLIARQLKKDREQD